MSRDYYQLCCRHQGRAVRIRDKFGKVHRGIIDRVSPTHVYIRPFGPKNRRGFDYGGFGYGGFGRPFGFGFGFGAAAAIALAAIVAFAVIPFGFFW